MHATFPPGRGTNPKAGHRKAEAKTLGKGTVSDKTQCALTMKSSTQAPDIHPKGTKTQAHTNPCTRVITAAFVTTVKHGNQDVLQQASG